MADRTTQNKQDDLLEQIRILGVQMAVIFLLYGLYAAFSFIAMYCLLLRGIRESRPRATLFIITFFEFVITTSYLVLRFVFFLIIIPKSTQSVVDAGPEYFIHIDSLASHYRIATEFMLRFIFVFSDGIVIWRTWSLFPYKTSVKVLLSLCLLASSICIFVDAGLYTEKVLESGFNAVDDPRQNMMVIIPLLITNLIATGLVCYTAWRHRRDIHQRLGKTKMTFKIQRILVLLSQSGFIYCVIWVYSFSVLKDTSLGIYSDSMPLIAALYPALIIMFTTLEDYRHGSQEESALAKDDDVSSASSRKNYPLIMIVLKGSDNPLTISVKSFNACDCLTTLSEDGFPDKAASHSTTLKDRVGLPLAFTA
ncbi:hypothetical protein K435DRAFT_895931 [Dendrothele bispora CBS 962.96]|uniref:Uncharacterized protein n=1 Tax=Dendrothele bispora (strain CBS 962.96) TaxID=1314807 RepID=A0A4S8M0L7_DENBC|nr:hypothetical protein K435DRAFT_895931 [Dendrothele bispora CBS 962.96]